MEVPAQQLADTGLYYGQTVSFTVDDSDVTGTLEHADHRQRPTTALIVDGNRYVVFNETPVTVPDPDPAPADPDAPAAV